MVDVQRLKECRKMKKRIVSEAKSPDNRASVRQNQRMTARCNNQGVPMYGLDIDVTGKKKYDTLRNNRKVIKTIKSLVKKGITYTQNQVKEAKKVINNANKYSEYEFNMASKLIVRLGRYKGLVCIDDLISKTRKVA